MRVFLRALAVLCVFYVAALSTVHSQSPVGREVAIAHHLQDGEEFSVPLRDLLAHGQRLFNAVWTIEEGGGRPLSKGTGAKLTDPTNPLEFPRNFNRVSAPDANSCAGCHNRHCFSHEAPRPISCTTECWLRKMAAAQHSNPRQLRNQ